MNICCDPTRGVYPVNIYSAILRRTLLSYLGSDNYRVIISTQELATLLDVAQAIKDERRRRSCFESA